MGISLSERELAEKLNDSSIDRVMAIDLDWKIIAWNKTSELLTGYTKNDVIGRPLADVFPTIRDDKELMSAIGHAFLGRKTFLSSSSELPHRLHVEHHFIPLLNDDGKVMGVMNIIHDVAHRIKAEKELKRLNAELEKKYSQLEKANNDLATFTYVASREIQEPIKNVYSTLEHLARKEGTLLSNTSRASLRKMQGSLNRMNLLLDDLLAISKINNSKDELRAIDLNAIVQNVKSRMATKLQGKNGTLTIQQLPLVAGSAEMLGFLFHHLIDNAIKFQDDDNAPAITVYCEQFEESGSSEADEGFYTVCIKDNGIGFEQKDAAVIFDMFTTLQQRTFRGSGIGLGLCKRIMDAHNGMISAESIPGAGSTFRCFFPRVY